jgi:hypothetical protein
LNFFDFYVEPNRQLSQNERIYGKYYNNIDKKWIIMPTEIEARAILKSKENIRQFQELKQYLDKEIDDDVSSKYSDSATTRLAIRMAHKYMENMEEKKIKLQEQMNNIEKETEKLADNI